MLTKRIIGIVVVIWSLLVIGWASVLVHDLSSPNGPILAKHLPPPGINNKAVLRHSGHTKPFPGG
jgi:hypothetical protein